MITPMAISPKVLPGAPAPARGPLSSLAALASRETRRRAVARHRRRLVGRGALRVARARASARRRRHLGRVRPAAGIGFGVCALLLHRLDRRHRLRERRGRVGDRAHRLLHRAVVDDDAQRRRELRRALEALVGFFAGPVGTSWSPRVRRSGARVASGIGSACTCSPMYSIGVRASKAAAAVSSSEDHCEEYTSLRVERLALRLLGRHEPASRRPSPSCVRISEPGCISRSVTLASPKSSTLAKSSGRPARREDVLGLEVAVDDALLGGPPPSAPQDGWLPRSRARASSAPRWHHLPEVLPSGTPSRCSGPRPQAARGRGRPSPCWGGWGGSSPEPHGGKRDTRSFRLVNFEWRIFTATYRSMSRLVAL